MCIDFLPVGHSIMRAMEDFHDLVDAGKHTEAREAAVALQATLKRVDSGEERNFCMRTLCVAAATNEVNAGHYADGLRWVTELESEKYGAVPADEAIFVHIWYGKAHAVAGSHGHVLS